MSQAWRGEVTIIGKGVVEPVSTKDVEVDIWRKGVIVQAGDAGRVRTCESKRVAKNPVGLGYGKREGLGDM